MAKQCPNPKRLDTARLDEGALVSNLLRVLRTRNPCMVFHNTNAATDAPLTPRKRETIK
jgi:hypothetical protein